ncbi:DNA-protecting protein DprA [Prolixibacteraceae bacterium JC049]|nr:DNA-protecting protein DprA [Prolixibacteraceae bacterium JC049]
MKNEDLKYKIASAHFPHIGLPRLKQIVAHTGTYMSLFSENVNLLSEVPGINKELAKNVVANTKNALQIATEELKFIKKQNLNIYYYSDDEYPRRLTHCDDAPIYFYTKGCCNFNLPHVISIVGTRRMSSEGKRLTHLLISDLRKLGITPLVVSGLAYGVDVEAHLAAIENGLPTVAVLGHHLGILYPASHKSVAQQIVENGALVSEFTSTSEFYQTNFVKRNRIVAGMADATIVVESAKKGGSLITAEMANSYNRDVFAFPGRTTDKSSQGCNNLIKTNQAALIESANDLVDFMGWSTNKVNPVVQTQLFVDLSPLEKKIVDFLMPIENASIDQIASHVKMSISKVSATLFNLEMQGLIIVLPGNTYRLAAK